MPLVFVHGVATRQTAHYTAVVSQRDQLFKKLVIGEDDAIFDPDWGSAGVSFQKGGWVPIKGTTEAFSSDSQSAGAHDASVASRVAAQDLDQAIDIAFATLFSQRADSGILPSVEEIAGFEAAVRYLETAADRSAFSPNDTNSQFVSSLESELKPFLKETKVEAMGSSDIFASMRQALKIATDPLRNFTSDALLRRVRKQFSDQIALFLGDIFVYLRWRETDGSAGTYNRIFEPIIQDLCKGNMACTADRKLVLVGHSLGSVILYDLLTDQRALTEIERISGKPLNVDCWVSVGAQPGLFADMGLYSQRREAGGELGRPECVTRWINVYDFTDVLSFRAEPFFTGVEDYEFDSVAGALQAHSAYFQRPSFYKRLRKRLSET
jgi:hypothetical protein